MHDNFADQWLAGLVRNTAIVATAVFIAAVVNLAFPGVISFMQALVAGALLAVAVDAVNWLMFFYGNRNKRESVYANLPS